jgi:hypothetical protein
LGVLNPGRDDGAVESTAVAGELALDHRLTLQRDRYLVEAAGGALRIPGKVEKSR